MRCNSGMRAVTESLSPARLMACITKASRAGKTNAAPGDLRGKQDVLIRQICLVEKAVEIADKTRLGNAKIIARGHRAAHRACKAASDENLEDFEDFLRVFAVSRRMRQHIADADGHDRHQIENLVVKRAGQIDHLALCGIGGRNLLARQNDAVSKTAEEFDRINGLLARRFDPNIRTDRAIERKILNGFVKRAFAAGNDQVLRFMRNDQFDVIRCQSCISGINKSTRSCGD